MDDTCRQHIKKNIEKLIRLTDYKKLMHACVATGLLTETMRKIIETTPLTRAEKLKGENQDLQHEHHRRLFDKLTRRGPDAYQILKTLLSELKFEMAVQVLNEPFNDNSGFYSMHVKRFDERGPIVKPAVISSAVDGAKFTKYENDDKWPKLVEYTEEIKPKVVHHVLKTNQLHVADDKVGDYPMKSQHHRGVLFMVNIIDFPEKENRRNGAEEDGESMLHLFKELNFKLFAYVNLTKSEFSHLLDAIIDSESTRDAECFVLVLMTHGYMQGNSEYVEFHDGAVVPVFDIEHRFENHKCPHLVHKPKILIFPFCRGGTADHGYYPAVQTDGFAKATVHLDNTNIPSLSDIIICYASMRGFKAHRDPLYGSWYIQKFYELMAKHAHDTSFEDILKIIQRETGNLRTQHGAMQMGSSQNIGFNKKLFFNPGAWEDAN